MVGSERRTLLLSGYTYLQLILSLRPSLAAVSSVSPSTRQDTSGSEVRYRQASRKVVMGLKWQALHECGVSKVEVQPLVRAIPWKRSHDKPV